MRNLIAFLLLTAYCLLPTFSVAQTDQYAKTLRFATVDTTTISQQNGKLFFNHTTGKLRIMYGGSKYTVWPAAGGGGGSGITSINTLTGAAQIITTGTSGTDVGVSSSGLTHTINIPTASGTNSGKLSSANWTTFNNKQSPLYFKNGLAKIADSTTVVLGGALTRITAIDAGNYLYQIQGTDGVNSVGFYLDGSINNLSLFASNSTDNSTFKIEPTKLIVTSGAGTFNGVVYEDGVGAVEPTYLPQTLTSKTYADEHLAGYTFTNSPSTNYIPQYNGTNITWVTGGGSFTTEDAQDAVGAMVDGSLTYVDGTPLLQRSALTGAITATAGSNATSLGSFTLAQLSTAVSDANVARTDAGQTFTGVQSMTSPDITTSITTPSTTFSVANTTATTGNLFGAATTLNVGGTPTGTITHNYSANATSTGNTKTINIGTGSATGSTTNVNIGDADGGTTTINSPLIDSPSGTVNLFNSATTLNLGSTATSTMNIAQSSSAQTLNLAAGALTAGTKTVNLGTGANASTTTNINIGDADGGTTTIASPTTSISGSLSVTGTPLIQFSSSGNFQIPNGASDALDITDGVDNILRFNTTDNRVELTYPLYATGSTGTSGQLLQSNGTGSAPSWATVAALTDGDKGDITVSGSGATWTVDNSTISLAKMADMATASLIYRKTAGTGAPEVNTLTTLKTDLGLAGTNNGDQAITNSSDATSHTLTLSGSGGTVQFIEGSNITLTTGGTGSAGTVTIASTGGGTTDLAFTGASSPVTLTSSTGTDVTFTAGSNITLTGTGTDLTIAASGGGGGITNGAANNELMKSDGTNAVASGIESTTAGNINLGLSGTSGTSRTIQAAGSGSNIDLQLYAKGLGSVYLSPASFITSTNELGIGASPSSALDVYEDGTATNNTPIQVAEFTAMTTGSAANGLGASISLKSEKSGGSASNDVFLSSLTEDVTSSSEDASFVVTTMTAGSMTEKVRFTSNGAIGLSGANYGTSGQVLTSNGSSSAATWTTVGALTDGDKGDITVSGSGATWAVDNSAISLAKMADMATASLIYRKTAGTGAPEVNTLATLKTDLALERTITFVVNEGPTISTGGKNYTRVIAPFSGTIVRWKLIADASSTTTLDVWKDAGAIPTNSNTITASAKPSLSAAAFNSSSTLTGWTTSVTEGDILIMEVESGASGCNYLSLSLVVQL